MHVGEFCTTGPVPTDWTSPVYVCLRCPYLIRIAISPEIIASTVHPVMLLLMMMLLMLMVMLLVMLLVVMLLLLVVVMWLHMRVLRIL